MSIKSLRAKWTQRRLDLAMKQIGNPTDLNELGMNDANQPQVRQTRGAMGSINRMTKATSHTEWKGD